MGSAPISPTSPTMYPTHTPPTMYPTQSVPTMHPTASVPTPFPTASTPTSYPTETAPTIKPTIACKAKGESCNKCGLLYEQVQYEKESLQEVKRPILLVYLAVVLKHFAHYMIEIIFNFFLI